MNAFRKVRDYVVFTRNEQKILVLLSVVLLAGAGIKAYRALTTPETDRAFEYGVSDSIFAARSTAPPRTTAAASGARLDLNRATRQQFLALPGIGPALADRMLAYRAAHARFRSINEVKKVAGIGVKKFERLRGMIEVTPDTGR